MKKSLFNQLSLSSVLAFAFIVCGALISAFISSLLYRDIKNELREELRNRLANITAIAAINQDGDALSKVSVRDDEFYRKIYEQNFNIRLSDHNLINVYSIRRNEQGIYLIVHANRFGGDEMAQFGLPHKQASKILEENFDTINRAIVEPDIVTNEFGTFISAYAPIYNASGVRTGVLGVDIDANSVLSKERQFFNKSLLIIFISLPGMGLMGYWLGRQLANRFEEITAAIQSFAEGNGNPNKFGSAGSKETALLVGSFNSMTQKLAARITNLETQISEGITKLDRRASQLEAVSDISRAIAFIQDSNNLLSEMVKLVSHQLDFYHVGIFLVDEKSGVAYLRAANSEGGRRMLDHQYSIDLDENSFVGSVISRGEPRIVLDGETDAAFQSPYLPDTLLEIAVPLKVGGRIFGALDAQSKDPDPLSEEDITILAIIADHIAIAIENARLSSEASEARREAKEAVARYIEREWGGYTVMLKNKGYLFDGKRTTPLSKKDDLVKNKRLPQTGRLTLEKSANELLVPIRLRGQIIGFINAKTKSENRRLTRNDIALLEAAAERAALALENARLIERAQRNAMRERTIGEISTSLGAGSDLNTIMQSVVEELGRRISGAAEVVFELENDFWNV